jgi:hypothetical protein
VTWLVFLPTLRGGFLPWDDRANLITNHAWRGIGTAQLHWIFTSFHMGQSSGYTEARLNLAVAPERLGLHEARQHMSRARVSSP